MCAREGTENVENGNTDNSCHMRSYLYNIPHTFLLSIVLKIKFEMCFIYPTNIEQKGDIPFSSLFVHPPWQGGGRMMRGETGGEAV